MPRRHDGGLIEDIAQIAAQRVARRQSMRWLATAGTLALFGCRGDNGSLRTTGATSDALPSARNAPGSFACLADPTETEGPFPADGSNSRDGTVVDVLEDGGIVRTDIRSSFGSSTVTATGVPLELTLTLVDASNDCAALAGYAVYVWHCDAAGHYSLYDLPAENYLRGVGQTDANGQVTFTTIFPACYNGRWPHIHFEIYPSLAEATTDANRLLVSQLALPRAVCNTVFADRRYAGSASNFANVSLPSDMVFGDNSAAQIAQQTPRFTGDVTRGYSATALIGLA